MRKLHNLIKRNLGMRIGTHSGVFHADDAMGCMLLREFTQKFRDAQVVRSRDQELLKTLDAVLDVGGIYDDALHRYDHHQKGFFEVFSPEFDIKLSASGLIFKHFGKEAIRRAVDYLVEAGSLPDYIKPKVTDEAVDELHRDCYRGLFVTIDAIDNGIDRYPKDVKPRFDYYRTDLASRVGRLNPNWWDDPTPSSFDANFSKAMDLCKEEFLQQLKTEIMAGIASSVLVEEAVTNNSRLDGAVVILSRPCFWKEALFKVEEKLKVAGRTKFMVYPDSNGEGFRVQAVPVNNHSFDNRNPLKEDWRGLELTVLREKSGIDDIVFCHPSGFIGGARSLESVLKMAEQSLVKSSN